MHHAQALLEMDHQSFHHSSTVMHAPAIGLENSLTKLYLLGKNLTP